MDDAIRRYCELVDAYPQLFQPRKRRKLVLQHEELQRWSDQNATRLGVLAETPFFLFLNDLVRTDNGSTYAYSRLVSKKSLAGRNSVVVLPIRRLGEKELVILVLQERHATGKQMLELPRGFAEPGRDEAEQAVEELATETGYQGTAHFLGQSYTDSGTTDNCVSFYLVEVTERGEPQPESTECIEAVREIPLDELRDQVGAGDILDGYTIQALAIYDRYLRVAGGREAGKGQSLSSGEPDHPTGSRKANPT